MAVRVLIATFGLMFSAVLGLGLGNYATEGVAAPVPPPPAYRPHASGDGGGDTAGYPN